MQGSCFVLLDVGLQNGETGRLLRLFRLISVAMLRGYMA